MPNLKNSEFRLTVLEGKYQECRHYLRNEKYTHHVIITIIIIIIIIMIIIIITISIIIFSHNQ